MEWSLVWQTDLRLAIQSGLRLARPLVQQSVQKWATTTVSQWGSRLVSLSG